MNLEERLVELGLREEYDEPRTLHGGLRSRVFWDIEKLFEYPGWMRRRALEEFIWEVGKLRPQMFIGIRKGGYWLTEDINHCLDAIRFDEGCTTFPKWAARVVLVDDVLTTGGTIRHALGSKHLPKIGHIAVLVNRSGMDELDGIPILSGVSTDKVT